MTVADRRSVLAALWRAAEHPEAALEAVELTGAELVLPSSFAIGTAAQATIAAAALAAAEQWRLRTGRQCHLRILLSIPVGADQGPRTTDAPASTRHAGGA